MRTLENAYQSAAPNMRTEVSNIRNLCRDVLDIPDCNWRHIEVELDERRADKEEDATEIYDIYKFLMELVPLMSTEDLLEMR